MRYTIRVENADNHLKIVLNDAVIYDKHTEGDPDLSDVIDITDRLNPHPTINLLICDGYNHPDGRIDSFNPWHFRYKVLRDTSVFLHQETSSGGDALGGINAIHHEHEIVLSPGELLG